MNVTKHGEYTYKLTRFGLINCYLVVAEDGLILIDASLASSAESILNAAKEIGKPITKIFITHGHVDHMGAVDKIAAQMNGVSLFASWQTCHYWRGDFSVKDEGKRKASKLEFGKVATQPTQELRDGDQIGPIVAFPSPGHCQGHMSYYDERDGTVFAGDSWQANGSVGVMGDIRWRFPFPSFITDNQVNLVSAERTLSYQPNRLCCGHGPVTEDAGPIMQAAFERAQNKF